MSMSSEKRRRPGDPGPREESLRLAALRRYEILDTPPDGSFDRLASIAASLFSVPIAIVSLVDHDRIWFKSHHGIDVEQIGRDPGLCASAIMHPGAWVVTDAKTDPRTLSNPLVAGEFGLRFYVGAPLRTTDGYNLGTLCVIDREPRPVDHQQIANLMALASIVMDQMELRLAARRAIAEMSVLLHTDTLTGLPNRRHFEEHVDRELALSHRSGEHLCFVVVDLDHFKRVNDELGHDAGDRVLREVASLLRDGVRAGDFVARWGGEEFALILEADLDAALPLLERLRLDIERHAAFVSRIGRPLTISVGATRYRPLEGAAAALKRADEALYAAKHRGRNRVVVA